ncbi:PucR family transcriptional regulator [Nocardia canadensis]|uniref:PucR family transcriptional regulator n=1 Tax=Nocardia canadensis TaxID=3065238 RepID=UPI0029317B45|nr:helix-turn-helix domain-containing protein [Nocardia canadensis]
MSEPRKSATDHHPLFPARRSPNHSRADHVYDRRAPHRPIDSAINDYLGLALLSDAKINLRVARLFNLPVADSFTVLVLSLARSDTRPTTSSELQCRRIRDFLAIRFSHPIPVVLTSGWGTVLIPATALTTGRLGDFVSGLTAAVDVPVTSVAVESAVQGIPDAASIARELLDVAIRLRKAPRLYRLADLALEHQLTRPGPGRDKLVSLLAPLDASPDLRRTLFALVNHQFDRRNVARRLHVHPNTIGNRLAQILELTGLPPTSDSQWRLYAAVVASRFVGGVGLPVDSTPGAVVFQSE